VGSILIVASRRACRAPRSAQLSTTLRRSQPASRRLPCRSNPRGPRAYGVEEDTSIVPAPNGCVAAAKSYRSPRPGRETERRTQRKVHGRVLSFTESLTKPLLNPDRRLPGPYEPAVRFVGAEAASRLLTSRPHVGRFVRVRLPLPRRRWQRCRKTRRLGDHSG
jgi:hypothetical protein